MLLSENVYFVKGFKNAAIYDLYNKQVYAVNEIGKNLLEKYLEDENAKLDSDEKEYIDKLVELNLLTKNKEEHTKELKKPKERLIYTWLEITDRCNLNCVHCYGEFGKPSTKERELVSTEDWKRIIDELISLNCLEIQLIGGEPTVHKYFYEILTNSHEK